MREAPAAGHRGPAGSAFTCIGIGGGASDALGRIGVVHDVMAHYAPALDFVLPDYRNYHCRELDYFDLFGVSEIPHRTDPDRFSHRVEMPMSEVLMALFDRRFETQDDTLYAIKPDIYHSRPLRHRLVEELERRDGLTFRFMSRLRYTPASATFSADPATRKVTFHLRRGDICGGFLFEDVGRKNPVSDIVLVNRPLLYFPEAVSLVEDALPPGSRVELVIASDGVNSLRQLYAGRPGILKRLDILEDDLLGDPQSTRLDITVVDRLIGSGAAVTLKTIDAMHRSEFVVTKSSSFPALVQSVSDFKLLRSDANRPLPPHHARTYRRVVAP